MEPQAAKVDVVSVTVWTLVWTFSCVQTFVQFKVNILCKLGWADLALVGLFTRVQSQVGF